MSDSGIKLRGVNLDDGRTAAAAFTSVRLEATPMSRLAWAPERSSPRQVGRPSVGAPARCSASEPTRSS